MSENYRRQDYDQYSFCIKETVRYVWEGILLVAVISYFFYRSIIIGFLLSPLILVYLSEKKKQLCKKRKWDLNILLDVF